MQVQRATTQKKRELGVNMYLEAWRLFELKQQGAGAKDKRGSVISRAADRQVTTAGAGRALPGAAPGETSLSPGGYNRFLLSTTTLLGESNKVRGGDVCVCVGGGRGGRGVAPDHRQGSIRRSLEQV